jgi:hypothetical protein
MHVRVVDALGASRDPGLPFLSRALDADEVQRRIVPLVNRGTHSSAELREIRVARHKAGRRCLVEYRFDLQRGSARPESMTVFGKARARGTDLRTHGLVESLWQAGFRPDQEDATAVPQPFGVVPEFHMWLQRGVPGSLATHLTDRPEGAAVMRRIAEGIHALHTAGIPAVRQHSIADELRILHERLPRVAEARPTWRPRIQRVLRGCERLAERMDEPRPRGIHRDFYADQLVVDGDRLYLRRACGSSATPRPIGTWRRHSRSATWSSPKTPRGPRWRPTPP